MIAEPRYRAIKPANHGNLPLDGVGDSMEVHETQEKIHEAGHGNRGVAIVITVLAALLAICEMSGKSAQHESLARNIEASNIWAFFQAKTIRQTVLRAGADGFESIGPETNHGRAEQVTRRITRLRETADRYETEPSTNEGRQELMARARGAEAQRDKALSAYHLFEY